MSNPVSISIIKIQEDEFIFRADHISKIERKKLTIGFNLHLNWSLVEEKFFVTLATLYKYKVDSAETELVKFVTTTAYGVKNLKSILGEGKQAVGIPDAFMHTVVGTAISNTRGMLAYKLAGTILSDVYVPLVRVDDLLAHFGGAKKETAPKKPRKLSKK